MLFHRFKTSLAVLLLLTTISLQIVAPLPARAIETLPVTIKGSAVPIWPGLPNISNKIEKLWETITSTDWLLKNVGEPAVRAVLRAAIMSITQQVVNWISADGGNNVGFVGNFEKTLTNELDDAAGEFLDKTIPYVDFCGDIGAYLRLNLRVPSGGLRQRARCSLSAIVANVQDFYDNFQNGGWEAFLKVNTDIQNNTAGAFLLTLDAKLAAESRRKEEFGAKYAKSGILGISQKTQIQCFPRGEKPPPPTSGHRRTGAKEIPGGADDGNVCITSYEEQTPGTIIEQTLKDANKTGIDLGVNAKFIDEAVVAPIISALLKRTIQSAHGIFGQSPNASVSYRDPLFEDVREIGPPQDALRARSDTAMFSIQGGLRATTDQTLAARKEISAPGTTPSRKLELAQKTEDLLDKHRTLLGEHDAIADAKLSSYVVIGQADAERVDGQISQTLNRAEPIIAGLGSSPSASPTGDLRTDTLNGLTGSRTQLASHIALVRQAIKEVTAAIGELSTTSIVANQSLFITQANQLSTQISGLAGDTSAEQSRVSILRQKLLSPDAAQLIDELKPRQNGIISTADKISGELNDFADALIADQEQINALKAKLVNPADGALIDTIAVQAASIIAEVRQLAAEINGLAADISTERTLTDALQQRLSSPDAIRLANRLNLAQANIIVEGDKINAEISVLTDTIAEEQARVSVLRQQLVSAQAGQIITEITTLTDAIAREQSQIDILRQQLTTNDTADATRSLALISQITILTDTIAEEQARVSVLRQQLRQTTDQTVRQQLQAEITSLLTTIQAQQTEIGTLRRELLVIGQRMFGVSQSVNSQIANLLADILIKQSRISTLREQLLAIGGTVNTEVARLLSDILLKQARIRMLREDLVVIRDLGRLGADIASNQSRIAPIPDQIRAKISRVIAALRTKQADIKSLMQRLRTQPQTITEAQREAALENYMELLSSPDSGTPGALENLQEADTRLRTAHERLSRVATLTETTGEVASAVGAMKNASDIEQRASQTMRVAFGFLDDLHIPDFTPQ